jgi:hypothetical protein
MRRGFTFTEILIGFVLVGLVSVGVVEGITQTMKYRRRIQDRVRITGVQQRLVSLLSSLSFVSKVVLKDPRNSAFANCLTRGSCSGEMPLVIDQLQPEPGLPPLVLTAKAESPNLLLVEGRFESKDPIISSLRVSTWLPRIAFVKVPEAPLPPLNCAKGEYLVGLKLSDWTPLCESPR